MSIIYWRGTPAWKWFAMTNRRHARALAAALAVAGLAGCGTYVPDGATVISVKNSKSEFDRADIRAEGNELLKRTPVNMKWYDTNTFITTATFSPGSYSFRARNYDGAGLVRKVQIVADKDYYEIEAKSVAEGDGDSAAATEGPVVSGQVAGLQGKDISVLFIGRDVILRSVRTEANGRFRVNAPDTGNWKVEVHQLGQPARSWTGAARVMNQPWDAGTIQLR